jgi:hypothetical protein
MSFQPTKEFIEQFISVLNQKTVKNYSLKPQASSRFFEIVSEGSDFMMDIFTEENLLSYSYSALSKRYGRNLSNYVSKHDMGSGEYGQYTPKSLSITDKTTVENLVNRVIKILPDWEKYHRIIEENSIKELNSYNKQLSFTEELKAKYRISGGMDNKVGYIKEHRVEVIVSGDKGDLMIRGLAKDDLFAILEMIKSS